MLGNRRGAGLSVASVPGFGPLRLNQFAKLSQATHRFGKVLLGEGLKVLFDAPWRVLQGGALSFGRQANSCRIQIKQMSNKLIRICASTPYFAR